MYEFAHVILFTSPLCVHPAVCMRVCAMYVYMFLRVCWCEGVCLRVCNSMIVHTHEYFGGFDPFVSPQTVLKHLPYVSTVRTAVLNGIIDNLS